MGLYILAVSGVCVCDVYKGVKLSTVTTLTVLNPFSVLLAGLFYLSLLSLGMKGEERNRPTGHAQRLEIND